MCRGGLVGSPLPIPLPTIKKMSRRMKFKGLIGFGSRFVLAAEVWACALASIVMLAGCSEVNQEEVEQHESLLTDAQPSNYLSLKSGEKLEQLALQLDAVATENSAAVHEMKSAEARLVARQFDRMPSLRPEGEANHDGNVRLGLSIEQMLWDGGRLKARMESIELAVKEASLRAWIDRNSDVFFGLRAYVELSRYAARLRVLDQLVVDLKDLSQLLDVRVSGGVADRGESLKMDLAIQEIRREIITDTSALDQSRRNISRYLRNADIPKPNADLKQLVTACLRSWPKSESPADALSRIKVSRSLSTEDEVRAQRFPRVIIGAGAALTNLVNSSTPGVSLKLDAGDMLGLEGKKKIEASILDSQASIASYKAQIKETQAELERLEAVNADYVKGIAQLRKLQQVNLESIRLYEDQLDAGKISIVDGIKLYREVADTEVEIINFLAESTANCLKVSQLRGLLAPYEKLNE